MNRHMGGEKQGRYAMKEGFSLVEVIIAIVLLALMSLPVLIYFTNAAVTTSRGRDTQKAEMAAESVMEELGSFDTPEQIEDYVRAYVSAPPADDPANGTWNGYTEANSAGAAPAVLEKRDIEVDGSKYRAKVELEYDYPTGGGSGYTNPNLKEMPEFKEVYAGENAVVEEADQQERAVSHFLVNHTGETQLSVAQKLSREIYLDIQESGGVYYVKAYYNYVYDGNAGDSYEALIANTKVKDLKNVYFFYNRIQYDRDDESTIVNNVEEYVHVTSGTSSTDIADRQKYQEAMGKLNVYLVCQKSSDEMTLGSFSTEFMTSYRLKFTMDTEAQKATYYTNLDPAKVSSSGATVKKGVVESRQRRRIAKVTVRIFDAADDSYSQELARLESSKGE